MMTPGRYDLPAKYRIAFWGKRGRCQPCDKEDRAISYFPPDKISGRNKEKDGTTKSNNYNGVLNPGDTGDVIQYAACPGPNERQNMRSTFQYFGKRNEWRCYFRDYSKEYATLPLVRKWVVE